MLNSERVSGIPANGRDAALFFAASPFRSTYFVLDSVLLLLDLSLSALILGRHGHELSWKVIVSLLLGAIALILPWQGALRLHRTLTVHDHEHLEPGLRVCLGHFANWIQYELLCTYIAGLMLLGALSEYFIRQ